MTRDHDSNSTRRLTGVPEIAPGRLSGLFARQTQRQAMLRFLDDPGFAHQGTRGFATPSQGGGSGPTPARVTGTGGSGSSGRDACLSAEDLMELALKSGPETDARLAHAARCPACGQDLQRFLSVLEGNPSAEEKAAIQELAVFHNQQELARLLAATSMRQRPGPAGLGGLGGPATWMMAGVLGLAALLVTGLFLWHQRATDPERELAAAYRESRSLELRIPLADYTAVVPSTHTRGVEADREPPTLFEAKAKLARELQKSPQDPHWQQLEARADVLGEKYDSAIDVLDRLLAGGGVTPDLLTDAAAAYYQRGLAAGSEIDRSTALDYLRRADGMAPTDPVVLFNEAIVMEDRGQLINAVEVWNRYLTVERDAQWAAEGRRRLTSLEITLNRLKSHESRMQQMMSSPQAMEALATDPGRLALLDEELSTLQLDRLLQLGGLTANIGTGEGVSAVGPTSGAGMQARGSPCTLECPAARKLLIALSRSLETRHHDAWLSDLLSPILQSNSDSIAGPPLYASAMGFLANAMHDDLTGVPLEGVGLARKSKTLFERLRTSERGNAVMQRAARAGEARAAVESVYALGLQQYLGDCRTLTGQLDPPNRTMRRAVSRPGHPVEGTEAGPWEGYPWIDAQLRIEEMICDDTPETREARRERLAWAEQIAQQSEYHLLSVRAHVMEGGAAQETGDQETASRLIQQSLRELYQGDSPPFRIANTIGMLMDGDRTSPRRYSFEVYVRESLGWWQMQEVLPHEAMLYLELAGAEMRIGKTRQAADHIGQAQAAIQKIGQQKAFAQQLVQVDIDLAGALLEHGDAPAAGRFLDAASSNMNRYSVQWALRRYAAARGQMEIAGGHLDEAEKLLEAEIHASEGNGSVADPEITADYAQTDHDLYAELAGVWLAQGREPKRILALWERFRLLVLGEPVQHCPDNGLDCDQSRLAEVQRGLSGRLLIGQILLPDRVLVYRVDGVHIAWSQTMGPRQTVPDEANRLQAAASSPYTSLETAEMLGSQLSAALLPALPEEAKGEATLLLEADPLLRNLPWPVLPSRRGPLGIVYPLEEIGAFLEAGQNLDSPWSGELSGAGVQDPARALVIGASIGDVGQPPLPDAAEEARVVGGLIHAQTVLIGQDATIASVANDLGSATVFHFAGHAVPSKDGTRLVLAGTPDWDEAEKGEATSESGIDGNFLRRHIPRACRLAVLSACTTGQRENSVDHPFQDMVATLGSLGVREVVATRWPIDSSTTVPFMSEFYKGITTGRNVALSLREARRVEFEKLSLKHPYTWGAFYVTGRGFHRLGRSKGDSSDKRWQSGF